MIRLGSKYAFVAFIFIAILFMSQRTLKTRLKVELRETSEKNSRPVTTHGFATTTTYDWESAAQRFKRRLYTVRKMCKSKPLPPIFEHQLVNGKHEEIRIVGIRKIWKPNMNFLVNFQRRLLVCAVPKSGSTSWHRTMWAIRRKTQNLSTDQNFYNSNDTIKNQGIAMHLPKDDGNRLIMKVRGDDDFTRVPPKGSSFRLILARHPFARFISGWNQKFMLSINYWVGLVKVYPRLLEYKKKIDLNRIMAFEDFAKYAANNPSTIKVKDGHFMPATTLCSPCEYDYTYVLKAESIGADEPWLKRRLGLEDIDVGRRGVPPGGSVVNDDLKGNIKKYMSMLSPGVVKGLYNIYKDDFELFGYTFNFTTYEAGGFD